jgi:thiamine kinase-like enzyme
MVAPVPVTGGMSNRNFRVDDRGSRFFVRISGDVAAHCVSRADEIRASRAAAAAGIAPAVVYEEPGAAVFRWVEGRTLHPEEIGRPATLARVVALLQRAHRDVGGQLRGKTLAFWVFHAMRDYVELLGERELGAVIERLERAAQPVEIAFAHNDLLAANFIDDGRRLWLVDWEYGGFNAPLFDLANLASNNELDARATESLLEQYYGRVDDALRRRFAAMEAASLLRETLWSMVSERHSAIPCDFAAYTAANRARFERAWARFRKMTE